MAGLEGRRILLVEDELLLAMLLEDMLHPEGCMVLGPVGRIESALKLAQSEPIDAALLDVNVAGELVYPVAALLARRHIGFAFMTGYQDDMLPAEFRNRPVLSKPFQERQLITTLTQMLAASAP